MSKTDDDDQKNADNQNDTPTEQNGNGDVETEMANKLDVNFAEHAEETEAYGQQTGAKLGKFKQKCVLYEQALNELVEENKSKIAVNQRNKEALRNMDESK